MKGQLKTMRRSFSTRLLGLIHILLWNRERRVQIPTHIPPYPSIVEPFPSMIPSTRHICILHGMLMHQLEEMRGGQIHIIVVDDTRPRMSIECQS